MRSVFGNLGVMAVMGLALSVAPAHAKKDKEEPTKIELTDISAFDDVFTQVKVIDRKVTRSEGDLKGARLDLNSALGIKKGTPISDALAELSDRGEGKLQVALNELNVPTLQITDAVPTNVSAAVDAVNSMTTGFASSVNELGSLDKDLDKLVRESKAMPTKLKDEFDGNFIEQLFKLPKTSKTLTNNIKITSGLPDRSAGVVNEMGSILGTVQKEFKGTPGGGSPVAGKPSAPSGNKPSKPGAGTPSTPATPATPSTGTPGIGFENQPGKQNPPGGRKTNKPAPKGK